MNETLKKRPIGLIIFGVLFIIVSVGDLFQSLNTLNILAMKEQQVKIMEDQLAQAEKTQDFKPSELQKEFVKAFKEFKIREVDFIFQFIAILFDIGLFLAAIFIFVKKRWIVVYLNWYFLFDFIVKTIDKIVFTIVRPIPTPTAIQLSQSQKIFLVVQNSTVLLLIIIFMLWYFNRRNIKDYFKA